MMNAPALMSDYELVLAPYEHKMVLEDCRPNWSKARLWDTEKRELLQAGELIIIDNTAMPGEAMTVQAIKKRDDRQNYISLIGHMARHGVSWDPDYTGTISFDTAQAATALFDKFDSGTVLPKISPNGEGGLMMVWGQPENQVLAVIDNWRIHLVTQATTPNAKYSDDLAFDGEVVPTVVLLAIPRQTGS